MVCLVVPPWASPPLVVCPRLSVRGGGGPGSFEPRVVADIPASIVLESGHRLCARLRDFSFNGMRIELESDGKLLSSQPVNVVLERAGEEYAFPAKVVFSSNTIAGLKLKHLDHQSLTHYVQCTFARSDNWIKSSNQFNADRPGFSFRQISNASLRGYRQILEIGPRPLPQIYQLYQETLKGIASFLPARITTTKHISS